MIVSVASGKGGTGKTTVAVGLALSIEGEVQLLDCDVEETNCHIFLKPDIRATEAVGVPVPLVDKAKCTACGECARICQFNAIAVLKSSAFVFPELCHGCGGCALVCPEGAISETRREVGVVEAGVAPALLSRRSTGAQTEEPMPDIAFVHGRLRVGEAMSPPVIRAVKEHISPGAVTIIDSPPGTSCPVVAAVKGSNYVILVTEPTPFGLHDLTLAVGMVRAMGIPLGVVLNRADIGDRRVHEYCASEDIPILLEIPDSQRIAEGYSRGETVIEAAPKLREQFRRLYADVSGSLQDTGGRRQMKELVVISGKGGTGKTSLVACFAALAEGAVLADCDVDAADLHLILNPEVRRRETFSGGKEATIRQADCTACGICLERCRYDAIRAHVSDLDVAQALQPVQSDSARAGVSGPHPPPEQPVLLYEVDPLGCEGCGVCAHLCPAQAIDFTERTSGEWFISETRHGPMAHARLGVAEENSGKLVTMVRKQASRIAAERGLNLVIIDGPPGIGCPVIASIGGASLVLAVTEPTVSGLHDLRRVTELAAHFRIPAMVCVNKADINPQMAEEVRRYVASAGLGFAGELPYDTVATKAQLAAQSVVEYSDSKLAAKVREVWDNVASFLNNVGDED